MKYLCVLMCCSIVRFSRSTDNANRLGPDYLDRAARHTRRTFSPRILRICSSV